MPEIKRPKRNRLQHPNPIQFPLWATYRLHLFPRSDPRFRQRLRGYLWTLPKLEPTHPIQRLTERIYGHSNHPH